MQNWDLNLDVLALELVSLVNILCCILRDSFRTPATWTRRGIPDPNFLQPPGWTLCLYCIGEGNVSKSSVLSGAPPTWYLSLMSPSDAGRVVFYWQVDPRLIDAYKPINKIPFWAVDNVMHKTLVQGAEPSVRFEPFPTSPCSGHHPQVTPAGVWSCF